MANGVFSLCEEDLQNAIAKFDKVYTSIESASDAMSKSLNNLKTSGLYDPSGINGKIKNTSSVLFGVKESISKATQSTFDLERSTAAKAEELEVPQDFVKNDATQYNTISDIKLSKNDGQAINKDNAQEMANEIDETSVQEERLVNIVKETPGMVNEIDENSVQEERLENIVKETPSEAKEIDESSVQEERLENIVKETPDEAKEIDESSVQEERLENIVKETPSEVEEIQESSVQGQNLQNISNNQSSQSSQGGFSYSSNQSSNTTSNDFNYSSTSDNDKKDEKNETQEEFLKNYQILENYQKEKQSQEQKNNEDNQEVL